MWSGQVILVFLHLFFHQLHHAWWYFLEANGLHDMSLNHCNFHHLAVSISGSWAPCQILDLLFSFWYMCCMSKFHIGSNGQSSSHFQVWGAWCWCTNSRSFPSASCFILSSYRWFFSMPYLHAVVSRCLVMYILVPPWILLRSGQVMLGFESLLVTGVPSIICSIMVRPALIVGSKTGSKLRLSIRPTIQLDFPQEVFYQI